MTRGEFKKHSCYLETRQIDYRFQLEDYRIRKVAALYERSGTNQRATFTPSTIKTTTVHNSQSKDIDLADDEENNLSKHV